MLVLLLPAWTCYVVQSPVGPSPKKKAQLHADSSTLLSHLLCPGFVGAREQGCRDLR